MDYRTCSTCKTAKPDDEMTKGYRCKVCQADADRAYYAANPERRRKQKRDARRRELLREYGLTVEQYDAMVLEANGRCAMCQREADLQVDHCHETGAVRGLLCGPCNKALGLLQDDLPTLTRAITYLSRQDVEAGEDTVLVSAGGGRHFAYVHLPLEDARELADNLLAHLAERVPA